MTVIAISGEVGAGKDTFSEMLLDRLTTRSIQAEIVRFAQPIKDMCYTLGIDPDNRATKEVVQPYPVKADALLEAVRKHFKYLNGAEQMEMATAVFTKIRSGLRDSSGQPLFSPRQIQQWIGGAARDIRQDYYIVHLLCECNKRPDTLVIVPDCRFPNEVGTAHTSVYIERPNNPHVIVTNDISEAHQGKLKEMAEFLIKNQTSCGEDWQDALDEQACILIEKLIQRGYLDDVSAGILTD